jgi:hypothetical protein
LPIALTDDEVKNLQAIAKTVPWQHRNAFVHRFEQLLALRKEPGPADVWRAAHFAAREAWSAGVAQCPLTPPIAAFRCHGRLSQLSARSGLQRQCINFWLPALLYDLVDDGQGTSAARAIHDKEAVKARQAQGDIVLDVASISSWR